MSIKKIILSAKSFSVVCMLSLSMSAFAISVDTEESFFDRLVRWIKETFFSETVTDDDISESDDTSDDNDIEEAPCLREKYKGRNVKIGEEPRISSIKLELDQLGFSLRKIIAEKKKLSEIEITGKLYLNYLDLYEFYRECLKTYPRKSFLDHQLFEYQGKVSNVIKKQLDCVKKLQ